MKTNKWHVVRVVGTYSEVIATCDSESEARRTAVALPTAEGQTIYTAPVIEL